jgi:hypothetical protein
VTRFAGLVMSDQGRQQPIRLKAVLALKNAVKTST